MNIVINKLTNIKVDMNLKFFSDPEDLDFDYDECLLFLHKHLQVKT